MKRPHLDISSLLRSNPYIKLIDQYIQMLENKIKEQSKKLQNLKKNCTFLLTLSSQYGIICNVTRGRKKVFRYGTFPLTEFSPIWYN